MSGTIHKTAQPHAGSTAYINAHIVDPVDGNEYRGAVLISDGKIADFGPNLFASGAPYGIESVDCRGLVLAPGLVDTRVHTGEPGEEHKETLESAGAAAAVGGITSLVLLPVAPIGVWVGVKIARRINPVLFYRLVYLGMFLTGSKLVWDAVR